MRLRERENKYQFQHYQNSFKMLSDDKKKKRFVYKINEKCTQYLFCIESTVGDINIGQQETNMKSP